MNNGMWIIRVFLLALFLSLVGLLIYAYGAGTVLAWAIGILVAIVGLSMLFRGDDKEVARMQAMNEYAAAIREVQGAAAAMRGCDNAERRARLDSAERKAEEAKKRLIECGGWLSQ